jgi:hypothetical protein
MTGRSSSTVWVLAVLCSAACGRSPSEPSGAPSFLAGTWQGTVTIEVNPGEASGLPATTAATTWTFEVVPQTNKQTFRATVQSAHLWLPITTVASTALVPTNTPPTRISTQGDYNSPRGCRGTFGSSGTAEAARIDADFAGVDCTARFTGRVVLIKQ